MKSKVFLATLAVSLIGVTATLSSSASSASRPSTGDSSSDCYAPEPTDLWAATVPQPDSDVDTTDDVVEASLLHSVLAEAAEAVVGVSRSQSGGTVHLVIDPTQAGAMADVSTAVEAVSLGSTVEIHVGCFSADERIRAQEWVLEGSWRDAAVPETFATFTDGAGRLVVAVDDSAKALDALAEYGDVLVPVASTISRSGRYDDSNPHYGGAAIKPSDSSSSYVCTANASTLAIFGLHTMPTAGHCLDVGTSSQWKSGPHNFGDEVGQVADYPTHDLGLLLYEIAAGETYDNKIHTEPGAPTVRTVFGTRHGDRLESICISGAKGHANCNLIVSVDDNTGTLTDPVGTTVDLDNAVYALNSGSVSCTGGDSGAPYYFRYSNSRAKVAGLHVGYIDIALFNIRVCIYHDAAVVQAETGTTYMTS